MASWWAFPDWPAACIVVSLKKYAEESSEHWRCEMSVKHVIHCCMLGAVLCWTSGVAARPDPAPSIPAPSDSAQLDAEVTEANLVGAVVMVGDDFLVLAKPDESMVRITTDRSTMITFEGRETTLRQVKPGCLAMVMAVKQGEVWHARMVQAMLRH
jgi:hypothetical protein